MLEVTDFGVTKDGWKYVETSDGTRYLKATDSRVEQLEQLCRDLLMLAVTGASAAYDRSRWHGELERMTDRMEALGLLEVD